MFSQFKTRRQISRVNAENKILFLTLKEIELCAQNSSASFDVSMTTKERIELRRVMQKNKMFWHSMKD